MRCAKTAGSSPTGELAAGAPAEAGRTRAHSNRQESSGNRSAQVTKFLQEQGYTNAHNMQGCIVAWQSAGFPVEK